MINYQWEAIVCAQSSNAYLASLEASRRATCLLNCAFGSPASMFHICDRRFRCCKRDRAGANADEVPNKRAKANIGIPQNASSAGTTPQACSQEQQQQQQQEAVHPLQCFANYATERCDTTP